MPPRTWKSIELKVARAFDSKREGAKGTSGFDVLSLPLAFEVKYRKAAPALLKKAMLQAEKAKKHMGEHPLYPVIVLAEHGSSVDDYFCVMKLKDFKEVIYG